MTTSSDSLCTCEHPHFISHAGWWRCRNCNGGLPYIPPEDLFPFMRMRIAEGRATVARSLRW